MEFADGVKAMARNTIPAIELVRKGKWSLDDIKSWLYAVIHERENDPELNSKPWLQLTRELIQQGNFHTY